jgi:23S rRNA pseudouridine2605 synthase
MEKQRLNKTLAAAGIASRRASEELIFAGRVTLNGQVVVKPQTLVDTAKDKIKVDGKLISLERKVYYILNKPAGYTCTAKAGQKSRIVLDLFAGIGLRLFTIGRLDRDTQGLLIVTNDGEYAQQVIHPSANIEKEYVAKTDYEITDQHLKAISKGTVVEGKFVKPARVIKVRKGTVKITVMEGKKREVRELIHAAGLKVRELTRVRIGNLLLNRLPAGRFREMSEREKQLPFMGKHE